MRPRRGRRVDQRLSALARRHLVDVVETVHQQRRGVVRQVQQERPQALVVKILAVRRQHYAVRSQVCSVREHNTVQVDSVDLAKRAPVGKSAEQRPSHVGSPIPMGSGLASHRYDFERPQRSRTIRSMFGSDSLATDPNDNVLSARHLRIGSQGFPQPPLLLPVRTRHDGPQVALGDGLPLGDAGQERDRFLDVGGEAEKSW